MARPALSHRRQRGRQVAQVQPPAMLTLQTAKAAAEAEQPASISPHLGRVQGDSSAATSTQLELM